MLSESLQTDRGVDNKVSNIDFVISDYLCTKNDNNMANICSLEEIIESFNDFQSTNNVIVDEYGNDLRGKAEIIVAKNTYGKTGKCDMVFDSNQVCFMEQYN